MNVETQYHHFLQLTQSPEAAATLVLASVQSGNAPVKAEYLTVKQAAEKLQISERSIARMIDKGLPVARVGKSVRIKPSDLDQYLEDSETVFD